MNEDEQKMSIALHPMWNQCLSADVSWTKSQIEFLREWKTEDSFAIYVQDPVNRDDLISCFGKENYGWLRKKYAFSFLASAAVQASQQNGVSIVSSSIFDIEAFYEQKVISSEPNFKPFTLEHNLIPFVENDVSVNLCVDLIAYIKSLPKLTPRQFQVYLIEGLSGIGKTRMCYETIKKITEHDDFSKTLVSITRPLNSSDEGFAKSYSRLDEHRGFLLLCRLVLEEFFGFTYEIPLSRSNCTQQFSILAKKLRKSLLLIYLDEVQNATTYCKDILTAICKWNSSNSFLKIVVLFSCLKSSTDLGTQIHASGFGFAKYVLPLFPENSSKFLANLFPRVSNYSPFLVVVGNSFGGWPFAFSVLKDTLIDDKKISELNYEETKDVYLKVVTVINKTYRSSSWQATFGTNSESLTNIICLGLSKTPVEADVLINGKKLNEAAEYGVFSLIPCMDSSAGKGLVTVDISLIMINVFNQSIYPMLIDSTLLNPFDISWQKLELAGLYALYVRARAIKLRGFKSCKLGELFPGALMPTKLCNRVVMLPLVLTVEKLFSHINQSSVLSSIQCGVCAEAKDLKQNGSYFVCADSQPDFDAAVYFPSSEEVEFSSRNSALDLSKTDMFPVEPLLLLQQVKSKQLIDFKTGLRSTSELALSDVSNAVTTMKSKYSSLASAENIVIEWITTKPIKNVKVVPISDAAVVHAGNIATALGSALDSFVTISDSVLCAKKEAENEKNICVSSEDEPRSKKVKINPSP